jgi:hypothetical protein
MPAQPSTNSHLRWAGLGLTAALTLTGAAAPLPASAATTGVAARATAECSCPLPAFGPGRAYKPRIDAAQFSPGVTNPWFPLKVGRTLVSAGSKDGKRALDLFAVTSRTKRIDGVRTRVVEDRLYLNNVLEERTSDYYAQDRCGNVWYFGEDTATLDSRGRVTSREGSFHAGVHGAQPGVFMQAHPQLGRRFRQEWDAGQAEDTFKAVQRNASITVPYGSVRHALRTEETTALEPGVLDNKYYVAGLGQVAELSLKGPVERLELVEVIF